MIKKILVPLDGSKLAEEALSYAKELAEKFEAELILLWVLHPVVVMSDYGIHTYDQLLDEEPNKANSYLSGLQEALRRTHLNTRITVLDGHPAAERIIDLACEEHVDLIVMSTHGRSGLSRWVYGSVTNKVLQHAPCPVYLIRSKEAEC